MTTYTIVRSEKSPPARKIIINLMLVGAGLVVLFPIIWVYQRIESREGLDVAQATMVFVMVILLAIVSAGMVLAYVTDRAIRKQKFIFRSPRPGSWVDTLIRAWGFVLIEETPEKNAEPAHIKRSEVEEALAILDKPRRRGRKPIFPIDRWRRVVLKWENRDPLRDTMTLAELLSDEFGTWADGSPKASEQTYYAWRDKVFAELKKEAGTADSSSRNPRGNMSAE